MKILTRAIGEQLLISRAQHTEHVNYLAVCLFYFIFSPQQPCIAATPHLRCHTSFVPRLTWECVLCWNLQFHQEHFAEGHWQKCHKLLWIKVFFPLLFEPKLSIFRALLQYRCLFDTIFFLHQSTANEHSSTALYFKKNVMT